MLREVEDRIADMARRQHGIVTRKQLLGLGLSPGTIHRELGSRWFHRVHRGVYRVGPIQLPRAREMAAVLACGSESLVSHRSAGSLRGWTTPEADSEPVDIMIPATHHRARPGIRVHKARGLGDDERAELDGIPTTSPGRTLVDLASVASAREVERAVARVEREGVLRRCNLEGLLVRYAARPGIALLRAVLNASGGPAFTRSEAEDRFLALIRQAGLPAPEVNAVVAGHEVDFLWRHTGVAVEVDGYRFHSSLPSFESDRRRAVRLAASGIQVIPLTWRQITDHGLATAVQIGQALVQARGRDRAKQTVLSTAIAGSVKDS